MLEPRDQLDLLDEAPRAFRYALALAMTILLIRLMAGLRNAK